MIPRRRRMGKQPARVPQPVYAGLQILRAKAGGEWPEWYEASEMASELGDLATWGWILGNAPEYIHGCEYGFEAT